MYSEKGNGRKAIVAYYLQKIRTKDSRHLKVSEYWVQPRKYTLLIFHTDKKKWREAYSIFLQERNIAISYLEIYL